MRIGLVGLAFCSFYASLVLFGLRIEEKIEGSQSAMVRKQFKSLRQAYDAGAQAFKRGKEASIFAGIPSAQRIAFYNGYYNAKIQRDIGHVLERMTGKGWDCEAPLE